MVRFLVTAFLSKHACSQPGGSNFTKSFLLSKIHLFWLYHEFNEFAIKLVHMPLCPPLLFAPLWKLLGRCRIPCSHPLLPRSFIFMSCPIIPACFSYLYHLFFLPEPVPDAHGVRHFVSAGLFILHVLLCHLLFLTSQSSVFFLRGVIYKQKKPHSS